LFLKAPAGIQKQWQRNTTYENDKYIHLFRWWLGIAEWSVESQETDRRRDSSSRETLIAFDPSFGMKLKSRRPRTIPTLSVTWCHAKENRIFIRRDGEGSAHTAWTNTHKIPRSQWRWSWQIFIQHSPLYGMESHLNPAIWFRDGFVQERRESYRLEDKKVQRPNEGRIRPQSGAMNTRCKTVDQNQNKIRILSDVKQVYNDFWVQVQVGR
jgi:hypothetical protein